jgi:uncharacterized protein YdhG (YjbR/CyaY superfamily)
VAESEVTSHLARFEGPQADALRQTRQVIAAALPGAEQVIAYGMPTFKISKIAVVGFDGFKQHNSLFPYSGGVVELVAAELPDWVVAKGTIRFPLDEAFPEGLLKRVLALRIEEINASFPRKSGEAKAFYDNGRPRHIGRMREGAMTGKWQWFRRDGTLERAGAFRNREPFGEWVTYDSSGTELERIRR